MSLLIARDYANTAKPLWVSSQGGTISGNLTVDGAIRSLTHVAAPAFLTLDPSGNTTGLVYNTTAPNGLLLQGDIVKFGKVGTGNVNTTFTPSVYGANTDNLTVGGTVNCLIGPVPTQIITSTKTVNPVAVSPAAPSQFGVDTTIAGVANAEYDVQVTGTVYCVSGTPDAADYIVYTFTSGGGQGSMSAIVYPTQTNLGGFGVGALGPLTAGSGAATINMRARVSPNASGTTLGANVRAFLGGGSTAVYGATLTICDVQRVR